jgi:acyl-CoA thioester hydrolase
MGIVHHSNYAVWFEVGRTDFMKKLGVSYSAVEARGAMMPLFELSCRFKSPARYEDELIITTRVKELTCVRIVLAYEVLLASSRKLLATGETMQAFTNSELKPINAEKTLPDMYALFKAYVDGEK